MGCHALYLEADLSSHNNPHTRLVAEVGLLVDRWIIIRLGAAQLKAKTVQPSFDREFIDFTEPCGSFSPGATLARFV
jgi:hypothetical protein